jgi:predicted dehydrogenase
MTGSARWSPEGVTREGEPGRGLRVGVTGASHWHLPRHAHNLREAGATFVAVCDPDPEIARRWGGELGCPVVPGVAEVAAARPDLVLALGRVSDMAAQATLLLGAGIPLLAEKPLGLRGVEVEQVAALARARGAWVSVALVQRYDPLWALLDGLRWGEGGGEGGGAGTGRLGAIAHFHMRIVNGPPQRYAAWGSGWMLRPQTAGGGALLNLGIHGVDAFLHLTGEAPAVAGAALSFAAHGQEVEDFGTVVLRAPEGAVGTVEAGYTYPDASAGMTRSGDNEVRVGASGAYLIARDADVWRVTADGEEVLTGARGGDRYRDWIFDSLARLRDGRAPLAGVEDCLAAVRVLDGAYVAAQSGGAAGGGARGAAPEQ